MLQDLLSGPHLLTDIIVARFRCLVQAGVPVYITIENETAFFSIIRKSFQV